MKSDDPKFTAFALNELSLEEQLEVEAAIAGDDALAMELEELQKFSATLRREFKAEQGTSLLPEQRSVVLGRVEPAKPVVVPSRTWWRSPWLLGSAAACVMAGLLTTIYLQAQFIKRLQATHEPVEPRQQVVGMPLRLEEREALDHPEVISVPSAPSNAGQSFAGSKPTKGFEWNQDLSSRFRENPGVVNSSVVRPLERNGDAGAGNGTPTAGAESTQAQALAEQRKDRQPDRPVFGVPIRQDNPGSRSRNAAQNRTQAQGAGTEKRAK